MRICYLCSDLGVPLDGHKGASAHVRGFVRALKGLGHEVLVLAGSTNGNTSLGVSVVPIPQPEFLQDLSYEKNPRMVRALHHICNNVATERILQTAIENFHPDLIYERYSPFAASGSILAKQKNIPHILEVNAILSEEGKSFRQQALQETSELLEHTTFHFTSLILAVSQELKELLLKLGLSEEKIIVMPNGVDEMFFEWKGDKRKTHPSKERIVLGFLGSLKPWHGIDILIDGFRELAKDPLYHLLVVGEGSMLKPLARLRNEFPNQIRLVGGIRHEEVPKYFHEVDIALAPYPAMENFYFSPLKILEYMALGKAIIASDIGQIKNLIRPNETGLLVPPGDRDKLIEAVRELSYKPKLRKKIGENARREARLLHTWKQRVSYILGLSKKLLRYHEVPLSQAKGVSLGA